MRPRNLIISLCAIFGCALTAIAIPAYSLWRARADESSWTQKACAHADDAGGETSSLCAQWRSADAAENAARNSQAMSVITFAYAITALATLCAAIAAAAFAKSAADHNGRSADEAKRSAAAAEEALKHTKSATAAQMRAYLGFGELGIEAYNYVGKLHNAFRICWKNYGNLPAKSVNLHIGSHICDSEDEALSHDFQLLPTASSGTFWPNALYDSPKKGFSIDDLSTRICVLWARADYLDGVSEERRSTEFRFILKTQLGIGPEPLVIYTFVGESVAT